MRAQLLPLGAPMAAPKALKPADISRVLSPIFVHLFHPKQLQALINLVVGSLHAGSLGVSAIGRGLAVACKLSDKSAIKQVDRFLSNPCFDLNKVSHAWIPYAVKRYGSTELFVNIDWTDFADTDQTTLVAALQTWQGRSIVLMSKTVKKSELKGQRNQHEDDFLMELKRHIPAGHEVTIIADRGFADQNYFRFIRETVGFHYLIRFKEGTNVTNKLGVTKDAAKWVGPRGRMTVLKGGSITECQTPVETIVCVQDKKMKDAWCLACSRDDLSGQQIKKIYGQRFSEEETFRDIKDIRYGLGLSWSKVKSPDRRDRLMFVAAITHTLLMMLGEAGEDCGLDRTLKVNSTAKRTLSLFRQGLLWFQRLTILTAEKRKKLLSSFQKILVRENRILEVLEVMSSPSLGNIELE